MRDSTAGRWIVAAIATLGIVFLLAWARNGPGVGGREPDPPTTPAATVVVVVPRPPAPTTVKPDTPTTDQNVRTTNEAVPPTS